VVVPHGIMAYGRGQEISGDHFCSLVEKLEEGMLAVGPGLPPDDGARLVGDLLAVSIDGLAAALHVPLLKIGREAVHVLIVGHDGFCLGAEEVIVPDPEEGQDDRYVFMKRGISEMPVHFVCPLEEFDEIFESHTAGNRKTNGGPEGVSAPTQSQKLNMFSRSMPNALTLSALVEIATKCFEM